MKAAPILPPAPLSATCPLWMLCEWSEVFRNGLASRSKVLLEVDADANILSTPNLVTLDNEEAKIVVGRKIPFPTSNGLNSLGHLRLLRLTGRERRPERRHLRLEGEGGRAGNGGGCSCEGLACAGGGEIGLEPCNGRRRSGEEEVEPALVEDRGQIGRAHV